MKYFAPHNLSFDHVVPKKLGGKGTWDNVVTACGRCEPCTCASVYPPSGVLEQESVRKLLNTGLHMSSCKKVVPGGTAVVNTLTLPLPPRLVIIDGFVFSRVVYLFSLSRFRSGLEKLVVFVLRAVLGRKTDARHSTAPVQRWCCLRRGSPVTCMCPSSALLGGD